MRTALLRLLLWSALTLGASAQDDILRLNQLQFLGTHNSYHIAPARGQLGTVERLRPSLGEELDYTHRPLPEQLHALGMRHFELDLYADPTGGRYARPKGEQRITAAERKRVGAYDPDGKMAKPGYKIIHAIDFDYRSTVLTLVEALQQIKTWSDKKPRHLPVMVLLELKDQPMHPLAKKPVLIDRKQLEAMEAEILSVFDRARIITPDVVRGKSATLREAVTNNGWPTLADARGKVMFCLDNGGRIRDEYFAGNPSLEKRLLFAHPPRADHPGAAFFKLNNPVGQFAAIQRLVKAGFMVRTRADSGTREARANDTTRRDRALKSGAHFISTDFPEPRAAFSDYQVRFSDGKPFRLNPLR